MKTTTSQTGRTLGRTGNLGFRMGLRGAALTLAVVAGCDHSAPTGKPAASSTTPSRLQEGASAIVATAYATFDPNVGGCVTSLGPNTCNVYGTKAAAYVGSSGGLADGVYFFAVVTPWTPDGGFVDGGWGNLSDTVASGTTGDNGSGDAVTNRTFTVAGGEIVSYTGTHATSTGPDGKKIISLMVYDNTDCPTGEYRLMVCPVGATSDTQCKAELFDVTSACGDGAVVAPETCDDGNAVSGDGCSNTCKTEACGDGVQAGLEQCDDGNLTNGDGCSSTCVLEGCGNGGVNGTEECDDGNNTNGDGCDATCHNEVCGNGLLQGSEQCDDGNVVNNDGCDSTCHSEVCGNGLVQCTEQCDDGNNANGDGCDSLCNLEQCGDGNMTGGETCDDGNTTNGDGCDSGCHLEICGNGIVQGAEQCDDGNADDWDGCDTDCKPSCNDSDGDQICDADDNCPDDQNANQEDSNGNGVGDACELICQTIRRDYFGTVTDTQLNSGSPAQNYGTDFAVYVGDMSGETRQFIIKFDLGFLPPGSTVKSASITLRQVSTGYNVPQPGSMIANVHRVTSNWTEMGTTWASFAGGFDPAVEATFPLVHDPKTFDVLALAQGWATGAFPNYGILVDGPVPGDITYAMFKTSEWVLNDRPMMSICYTIPE